MENAKAYILTIMQSIAENELSKDCGTLQSATYNDQKVLISALFDSTRGYNTGIIMLRLVVIDSLYSTNASYSYFSFEEMAEKIYKLGSEDEARKYFYHIATLKGEKDNKKLFEEPFGIQKNLSEGSKQMSLLSKYAYYALYNQKQYPLGFPIYDSLALDAYPTVCKMLGIEQHTEIANDICNYVAALDNVRTILFGNDDLFQDQYQQFDILDAYLWRMGKFSGGNLSLLLGREDYVTFIKNLGLNANPIVGRKNAFYEKDSDYKSRMMKKGTNSETEFDFNKTIVKLYIDSSCQPFIGMKDPNTQAYMEKLLEHWRIFNNAKKLPARFIKKVATTTPSTSVVSTTDCNTQTRNRDKANYVFNGKVYTKKVQLVHDLVLHHLSLHPDLTHEQLKKDFQVQKNMDVMFMSYEMYLSTLAKKGIVYFFESKTEEDTIALQDAKILISSNWPTMVGGKPSVFAKLLDKAKELGYEITVQE